jgi:heptosyltransferase-1
LEFFKSKYLPDTRSAMPLNGDSSGEDAICRVYQRRLSVSTNFEQPKSQQMADILFIKTSSLGDVIHHMPALTEARIRRPDARFAWVVEEAYAPLVRLHPAVEAVLPVASRRWRGALQRSATWREMRSFGRALRAKNYDEIIDTQGLGRSALIAHWARGRAHGYDADSIKERLAVWFYDVQHRVGREHHAIARNRSLTALALGYASEGAPDFGLDRARLIATQSAPYGILLHATARTEKEWPEDHWRKLAGMVGRNLGRDLDLVLPFGTANERARSERIASGIARARVPDRQPLDAMARLIAGAAFVVGVDTGLLHLAAALGVPLVAVFVGSEPGLTGPMGVGPIKVLGGKARTPSVPEVAADVERILAMPRTRP